MQPRTILLGLACFSAILASGCRAQPIRRLPDGVQTVTGVLKAAGLSIGRRGTHMLVQGNEERFYVESSKVALREHEGKEVTLTGTFEHNIDPRDLPVLNVTEIRGQQKAMHPMRVTSLRLHLDVPEDWKMTNTSGSVQFTASGGTRPVLTLAKTDLAALPAGSPVLVNLYRGTRVVPAGSADQVVYVQVGSQILSLTLTPDAETSLSAPALFLKILRSVTFDGSVSSKSTSAGGSASDPRDIGPPCGGAAGILCPAGFYCAITDSANNIGVCRKGR